MLWIILPENQPPVKYFLKSLIITQVHTHTVLSPLTHTTIIVMEGLINYIIAIM